MTIVVALESTVLPFSFCQKDGGGWIGESKAFFVETFQDCHVDVVLIVLQREKVRRFEPDVALDFQGIICAFDEGETGRLAWNHDAGHIRADFIDDLKSLLHLLGRGLIDESIGETFAVEVAVAEIVQLRICDDAVRNVDA